MVVGQPLSAEALVTAEYVKQVGGKEDLDSSQDQAINLFVNAASRLMLDIGREWKARADLSTTRIYDLGSGRLVPFGSWGHALQSASLVELDPPPATPFTLASTYYRLQPAHKPNGVYSYLETLSDYSVGGLFQPRQIRITGTWGFPSVPEHVKLVCATVVLEWLQRNQEVFSATFNLDTSRVEIPDELPSWAAKTIRRQRIPTVLPLG